MRELLRIYKAILFLPFILLCAYSGNAQTVETTFEFKIQIQERDSVNNQYSWGVYVRPTSGFSAGDNGSVTASGQITVLMDNGTDSITNIESVNGNWNPDYDLIRGPMEDPSTDYFFIGLDDEGSGIPLEDGVETLLFTFQANVDCPSKLALIDNLTDPFNADLLPGGDGINSKGNNPGMDLSVFNVNTLKRHNWVGNYALNASSCEDCDMDGIPDGIEDTNGNGVYDDGTGFEADGITPIPRDSSDLCDACDPLGITNFSASLEGGDILNMCELQDSAGLVVTMTGGLAPYTVHLGTMGSDGSSASESYSNILSGDTFYVKPLITTDYVLDSIVDAGGCALTFPDSLKGAVTVTVEGPLNWVGVPGQVVGDDVSCTLDTLSFKVDVTNDGDGDILYQWMVKKQSETNFSPVVNGTPYSGADTDSLIISNPDGLDGFEYYAKIFTETCDTLFSDTVSLSVEGPFEISVSPADLTACGQDTIEMVAETANIGSGSIVKQWEVNTGDGTGWNPVSNGGNYDGVATDTLEIKPASVGDDIGGLNDHWYRLKISGTNGKCNDLFTDSARLVIEGPITIDPANLPKNTASCSGEAACFGVQVDPIAGVVEYQWYLRSSSTAPWEAMINNNQYSGVRSDSMCVLDAQGLDGFEFKVDIETGACTTVSSEDFGAVAQLTVTESISFNIDPQSETICGGDSTLFIVDVVSGDGTLTKQWQMSDDGGSTWEDVLSTAIFSGADSDTLIVDTRSAITNQPDTLNGRLFRMNVGGDLCDEVLSREAELTVHHFVDTMIVMGPLDTTICSGNPAFFEVNPHPSFTGDPEILKYRWQILNPASNEFVSLTSNAIYNGVTTNRLSISDVNGFNGMKFRAVVFTNKCDSLVHPSDTIKLTVDGPYEFGQDNDAHPQDTMICVGETAIFSASPVLDLNTPDIFNDGIQYVGDSSTLVYEWVFNELGDYENPTLVNTAAWYTSTGGTGADETTLTVPDVGNALDGYAFWLRVYSTECGPVSPIKSFPAILNVAGPLNITTQPVDANNCSDKGAVFGAVVTNSGFGGQQLIEYSWQEIDLSDTWTPVVNDGNYNGANSDTLSIDVLDGLDGYRYALIASINGCGIDTTNLATLTERFPVTITDNPADIKTCAGAGGFFAVTVDSTGNEDVDIVWQVSTDLGRNWSAVSNASPYNTPRADTLEITDVTGLNGYRYRVAIATTSCDTIFSLPARVTAEGPVIFNAMMDTTKSCQNVGLDIEATIDFASTGPGVPQLQWQVNINDGNGFTDLSNDDNYDATTTNHLFVAQIFEDSITNVGTPIMRDTFLNLDGYQYRIVATTEECAKENTFFPSDTVTIQLVSSTADTCDFDLDGEPNNVDYDDDNDGLMDTTEIIITNGVTVDSLKTDPFNTDTNNNGILDSEEDADGDTINNGEETDDDNADGFSDDLDVFTGDPLDPCDPVLSPACIGVVLDVRVKLQGAMIGVGKEQPMRDDLRQKGIIPSVEPYSTLQRLANSIPLGPAFVHVPDHSNGEFVGGEEEITDPTILNDYGDNSVVDWVFVELRSGLQLDSVVATRSALLQRDGDVRDVKAPQTPDPTNKFLDADGFSYLRFDSTLAGEYYVSVKHRNHLGVMTNEAGLLSPKVTVVDFIDPNMNALGVHPQRMIATLEGRDSLGSIEYTDSLEQYMWAGDINSDGKIIYQGGQNDIGEMINNIIRKQVEDGVNEPLDNYILAGYRRSDYNLDGNTIYQGPLNDRQMLIFDGILAFPDNQKLLANYVILEQLP